MVSPKMALLALKKRFSEKLLFPPEFSLFLRARWMRMICGAKATVLHFSGRNWKLPETQKSREISDFTAFFDGGPGGIRTLDLSDANRTLSQLSYRPLCQFWGRDLGPRYVALALPAELRAHILFNSKHYNTVFQKNPVLFFIFRNFLYAKRADRFGPTLFSQIIRLFCRS